MSNNYNEVQTMVTELVDASKEAGFQINEDKIKCMSKRPGGQNIYQEEGIVKIQGIYLPRSDYSFPWENG